LVRRDWFHSPLLTSSIELNLLWNGAKRQGGFPLNEGLGCGPTAILHRNILLQHDKNALGPTERACIIHIDSSAPVFHLFHY
jgi:hypothetical protein